MPILDTGLSITVNLALPSDIQNQPTYYLLNLQLFLTLAFTLVYPGFYNTNYLDLTLG